MEKNSVKVFALKITAFLFVTFAADFIIGHLLKTYYFKQESGFGYQTTYAIEKNTSSILILGSSRGANLYNPLIFEKQLNMTCYNAGIDAFPLFYHYAILKASVKRNKPKIVILSFDAGNFSLGQVPYDQLRSLLPFYKSHPEIREVANLKGPYENIKMASSIYPFNSELIEIISGNSEIGKRKYSTIKGYIPLKGEIKGPLKEFDYTSEKQLDSVKINTYISFIKLCLDSQVRLYVVCPPYLINSRGTDISILSAKKISDQYKINFFDYSRDTFYTARPYLFNDFRHLNEKGVTLFSNDVINKIENH